jgi:uncharacterized membrane protein
MEFFVWVMFAILAGAALLIPLALSVVVVAWLTNTVNDILGLFKRK